MYLKQFNRLNAILVIALQLIVLFGVNTQVVQAGKWAAPNGNEWWSMGQVCRDGVDLRAVKNILSQPLVNETFHIYVHWYYGPESGYPVSIPQGSPELITQLGETTLTLIPSVPILYNLYGNIRVSDTYAVQTLYWDNHMTPGNKIFVTLHSSALSGEGVANGFVGEVQDCYLAPDAPIKSPELQFSATVSTQPDTCTSDTDITVASSAPVYTCLIIENTGDVTFDEHTITDNSFGNDTTFPLTILPGTHLSITHAIAQQAGLGINLGPFQDEKDLKAEFAWEAIGDSHSMVETASIKIKRTSRNDVLYLSSSSAGNVGGVTFRDEDILRFDHTTDQWAIYFDGSDVGLGNSDVNAFHIVDSNTILLSIDRAKTLGGVVYDDSDIIQFEATSLGTRTRGTLSMYFDGSDVGLTTNSEDIDALALLPDGDLVISTLGSVQAPGIRARDEDLLHFNQAQLGFRTSGLWSLYLDGSDLRLTNSREDIWATWIDADSGDVHLSTYANHNAASWGTSQVGDSDDIFVCTPGTLGSNTQCALSHFWNGDNHNFDSELIDGYTLGPIPLDLGLSGTLVSPIRGAAVDDDLADEMTENDDDLHDDVLDDDEYTEQVYLPLISR